MTIAAKHFDPQLGIDIHTYATSPSPIPTPHIGIVFDPFDYIPFFGATVEVEGIKRATAGSGGLDIHIPVLGPWLPTIKMPMGPQWDDEIFMGSRTVAADGDPFSRVGMPVLSCNLVGMVAPFRPRKPKKPKLSLELPTTVNVAVPSTVFVGGPPTISLTAMLMKGAFAGLGFLRKSKKFMAAFKKVRQKAFKFLPDGTFLKCKILRAEPVDIRDGSVSVTQQDFDLPGRLPLAWLREYSSTEEHAGVCGVGWRTPADIRLEIEPDGSVWFVDVERSALFAHLPQQAGLEHALREPLDGARLYRDGDRLWVRTKAGLCHGFACPPVGLRALSTQHLPIEEIADLSDNHWRFERRDGQLLRIVESGTLDAQGQPLRGRFIQVEMRGGRIGAMQLHDPATGQNHPLVSYRYDARGHLMAALDPLEAARSFEYGAHGMVRHTDRLGLSFYYAYDAKGQVVHAWGDGGLYDYRFAHHDLIGECEITDSLGHSSRVKFDADRLPLCEIDALNGITRFEYDEVGRTTAVVDPMGLRTEFAYDERGNELSVKRPDGSTISSVYDEEDQLIAVIDPLGHRWAQANDELGRPLSQTDPLGAATRFEYDAHGQLCRHINARGAVTHLHYNRHGQLSLLTDALGHASRFEHDGLGRLEAQFDPLGQRTAYHYDVKGRLLRIEQPDGAQIHCSYDAEDNLLRYVDEAGIETRLDYVGISQIGRRIQPDGHTVQYHYDTEEQLIGLTNQRGERYTLRRDALGRIVQEIDYWGQSRHYEYDAAGRLKATVDPLGQRIAFTTDKLGQIIRKSFADAMEPGQQVQEHFVYDPRGQLLEMRNGVAHVKRSFDPAGRLLEELQNGFKVANQYDEVGNRVLRETSAGNRLACAFDVRNQVSAIAINDAPPIALSRDALGRTTQEQLSPQVQRQFEYDARSQLTAQSVLADAQPLFDTRYDYDRAGNLTQRRDSQQGTDEYRYDVLGQLLQHTDPRGRIQRFLSDPAGDRLQTRITQVQMKQQAGAEGDPNSILWTREGSYEGVHYVFDRAGDLIRQSKPEGSAPDALDLELSWDANHRLLRSSRNGQVTTYGYDPVGRRVFKRNPTQTTHFFWDGDALLGEVQQANDAAQVPNMAGGKVVNLAEVQQRQAKRQQLHERVREYLYYPGSFVPLALIEGPKEETATDGVSGKTGAGSKTIYHYHTDPNGCPTRITSSAGQVKWSASYQAWGAITQQEAGQIANPLRFQGQYFDGETGLHYNRYRYYDPLAGQFIGQDPIGLAGGVNIYQYAPGPLGFIDPLGLKKGKYDVSSNVAATDIPARGVHVNVHGEGLPSRGGHVTLVPIEIKDPKGRVVDVKLGIEPADRAAKGVSAGQWGRIEAAIKEYMGDEKNVRRLLSAAQGGLGLPPSSMTPERMSQVRQTRDVLGSHLQRGSNPCV